MYSRSPSGKWHKVGKRWTITTCHKLPSARWLQSRSEPPKGADLCVICFGPNHSPVVTPGQFMTSLEQMTETYIENVEGAGDEYSLIGFANFVIYQKGWNDGVVFQQDQAVRVSDA